MSFRVKTTPDFEHDLKQIAKKYKAIKGDILNMVLNLEKNPTIGTRIGNNLYKIRLSITGSGKGKSGGARVITYVKVVEETVLLTRIYLKSNFDTIDEKTALKNLSDQGFI